MGASFIKVIFIKGALYECGEVFYYDEHDSIHQGDFTLVYYIRRNEDNLDDLIERIVGAERNWNKI